MRILKLVFSFILLSLTFLSFNNGELSTKIGLKEGNIAPGIETKLLNGKEFNLDSLKGKMVLVDFWASYDGKSRTENPQKMTILKEFEKSEFRNAKGFVIVSISLDRFKSPLQNAIKNDGFYKALHICDYKGVNSDLAKSYKANKPVDYLIDGKGRILTKSHDLNQIKEMLENYLISDFKPNLNNKTEEFKN